ncbi:YncE family protein [Fodinibius sp. Rm-B-1B1-1]|uniref:YncE family protein n=1 Tax=Fodinibius alkaliphilus TaxID=3140241 RepID=UPI003159EC94
MFKRYLLYLFAITIFTVSCGDDNSTSPEPDPLETTSVYVTNEGNFSDGNGSVTSYDPADKSSLKNAFEDANNRPLAGIIQSAHVDGDRMYLVINSANKIEVVDKESMESLGTIEMSVSPTAIEVIDDETAFATTLDYQADIDSISVLDLSSMEETGQRIGVGNSPRDIVRVGDQIYVTNNGSGYGNTISIIDAESNSVEQTIEVGTGPSQMVVDNEDRIWIVCNGRVSYDESTEDVPGSIYLLDGQTGQILNFIESDDIVASSGYKYRLALNIEDARGYLLNNGISMIDMNDVTLSDDKLIDRAFNAIGYLGPEQRIYVGQSNGYSQPGQALLYDLEGAAVDSFAAGIAPNGFHFVNEN